VEDGVHLDNSSEFRDGLASFEHASLKEELVYRADNRPGLSRLADKVLCRGSRGSQRLLYKRVDSPLDELFGDRYMCLQRRAHVSGIYLG
jgi:hypothetical protein